KFNRFVPGAANRGQPTTFAVGTNDDVFTVTFDGKPIAWLLTKHAADASRNSTACGPPPPMCPPSCDDGNPCPPDRCTSTTDFRCVHTPVMDGMTCSDGNVCDGAETCKAGVCVGGPALDCDDHNACTADSCDPVAGCKHTPVSDGTSCVPSGGCGGTGTCQAGQCTPPGNRSAANNPCTA